MKILELNINNYKQFKNLSLDLTYPQGHEKEGQALDKICIIGQSGTGKTNLLNIIKKSTVDFSKEISTYKPFNKFSGEKTDDKYISSTFVTSSNIEVKTLFTESSSKIESTDSKELLFQENEKNYFVGTKDYSKKIVLNNETKKLEEPIVYDYEDRKLINSLERKKIELKIEKLGSKDEDNYHVAKTFTESLYNINPSYKATHKINEINNLIESINSKYQRKEDINTSIENIKNKNLTDKYIVNINEGEYHWSKMKEKIQDYVSLKNQFKTTYSNKLLDDDNYSKEDYRNDFLNWEEKNENLLNKISKPLNEILIKFNLELAKIDENQSSYNDFKIKDLSNDNILEYDDLSTGTKNLLSTFIPLKTYSPNDSIVLIDEPEMSFYPNIQQNLIELYSSVGENNQLIVATHSPIIASSFEPWEIVELKFDENNQIFRELYFEKENHIENHIDNYTLDPRMLTWTGILTDVFDLKEDSNFTFREKALMKYATLKEEIKKVKDNKLKKEKIEEILVLSKKLGLNN